MRNISVALFLIYGMWWVVWKELSKGSFVRLLLVVGTLLVLTMVRTLLTGSGMRNAVKKMRATKAPTSVAGNLILKKFESNQTATIILAFALVLGVVITTFIDIPGERAYMGIVIALLVALQINAAATEYRIAHGLYGTSESEAREILAYVARHYGTDDFSGGAGFGDFIEEPEVSADPERLLQPEETV